MRQVLRRRDLLVSSGTLLSGALLSERVAHSQESPKPSEFQIACMTYVYRQFPLALALEGIARAGYRYVAWGTEHVEEGGRRVPLMAPSAPAEEARRLGERCRNM